MNVAFYADGIIERFDLENLEALSELDVKILWREVAVGLKVLKFQKFDRTELARLSGMKRNNLRNFGKLINLVQNQQKIENTENPFQNNKKRPHLADLNGPKKKAKVEEKCEFCSSGFGSKKLLLSHQKFHHFVYKCPLCDQSVRGIINGQTHLRNVHKKSAPESRLRFHFF